MTRLSIYACIGLILLSVGLAACSGGGGGVASSAAVSVLPQNPAPTTSGIALNLQPANTTVTYQALAATATGAGRGMNNITLSGVGQGATVTLTSDVSGNLSKLAIPAGNISNTYTANNGASNYSLISPRTLDFTFQLSDTLAFHGEDSSTLSQVAAGQGLSSSAYGMWASTTKNYPGDVGVFAIGNLTPATSVPSTGSATFNGFTIGTGGAINSNSSDGSSAFFLKGNVQIIANFSSQKVTTNLTNFVIGAYTASPPPSVPDLTGSSSISGNAFTGPVTGGGLTGTINGNFYGSAAQETAGVWQASGSGNAWIGSFGAK